MVSRLRKSPSWLYVASSFYLVGSLAVIHGVSLSMKSSPGKNHPPFFSSLEKVDSKITF